MSDGRTIRHHFTVDVEESFQVAALEPFVARSSWDTIPRRVERNVGVLLELMAAHRALGTFFVLSWIAERHPNLIREIARAGHEVASHGSDHKRVTQISPEEFRASVRDSKAILEDVSGQPVLGYRAPSFSIVRGGEWALDILIEEGYSYDSSLYPVRRAGYGFANGAQDPHRIQRGGGALHEFPPTTLRAGPRLLPAGGGAYFRHLPFVLAAAALHSAARRGVPGTFYIHPWEVDPEQPRINVPPVTRLRHYGNLRRTLPRLAKLFSRFQFQPIVRTIEQGTLSSSDQIQLR